MPIGWKLLLLFLLTHYYLLITTTITNSKKKCIDCPNYLFLKLKCYTYTIMFEEYRYYASCFHENVWVMVMMLFFHHQTNCATATRWEMTIPSESFTPTGWKPTTRRSPTSWQVMVALRAHTYICTGHGGAGFLHVAPGNGYIAVEDWKYVLRLKVESHVTRSFDRKATFTSLWAQSLTLTGGNFDDPQMRNISGTGTQNSESTQECLPLGSDASVGFKGGRLGAPGALVLRCVTLWFMMRSLMAGVWRSDTLLFTPR